jgi:hypothetical protein
VKTRDWFDREGIAPLSLDVFTSDVHARRSHYLYQLALTERVQVGVVPSRTSELELERWWRSSSDAKRVAVEFVGWAMVRCCFTPGEPGSHFERWGIEK